MKSTRLLLPLLTCSVLSSCATKVIESPVVNAPAAVSTASNVTSYAAPAARKTKPAPKPVAPIQTTPIIPLKPDSGISPLIHNTPDTPTYRRSNASR